jgi:small-conductance mechanosensitive channel
MLTYMNWSFLLPAVVLLIIIFLNVLVKKKPLFQNLKSIIPYLFFIFLISLSRAVLNIEFVNQWFLPDALDTINRILVIGTFLFILVIVVKTIVFLIFDFLIGKKQKIKYPRLIKDVTVIALYIVGISLIAKHVFNTELTVILASSAVLTVVIGFALQDILGDLFSGIALNLEESLRIGDWINTGDYEGKIEQFRWRCIKIQTIDNHLVLIPNRIAAKEEVERFGRASEPFALRFRIGVSYRNSPDFVIATIMEVLNSIDSILKEPRSMVMVVDFADFAVIYEIRFWINDYSIKDPVKSEIRRKTWYAFKRNGIQIPFPIRDVYIKDIQKEKPGEITTAQLIDILKRNEILDTISEKQLENLAADMEIKTYGKGETLIKEGEVGEYFYHILEGEAEVVQGDRVIARMKTDDYVGEMALFTGEKTTAEVRVKQESKILRISSEKFRETVQLNAKMARKLSEVIARRKAQLMEIKKEQDQTRQTAIKKETESIFLRIKKYFSF